MINAVQWYDVATSLSTFGQCLIIGAIMFPAIGAIVASLAYAKDTVQGEVIAALGSILANPAPVRILPYVASNPVAGYATIKADPTPIASPVRETIGQGCAATDLEIIASERAYIRAIPVATPSGIRYRDARTGRFTRVDPSDLP